MQQLDQLVHWAKDRYQRVAKDYEKFDESWAQIRPWCIALAP